MEVEIKICGTSYCGFYITWDNLLQMSQKPSNADFKDSADKENNAKRE